MTSLTNISGQKLIKTTIGGATVDFLFLYFLQTSIPRFEVLEREYMEFLYESDAKNIRKLYVEKLEQLIEN